MWLLSGWGWDMIGEDEVLDILRTRLSINIKDTLEFGPVRHIEVILKLDDEIIDSDYFDLPEEI